ncbi:unnamed protein product, partial [Cyprideis torosa]
FSPPDPYLGDGVKTPGTACNYRFEYPVTVKPFGRLNSLAFPSILPHGTTCIYTFKSTERNRIAITFHLISLDKIISSCLTSQDDVIVYDGPDAMSPVLAQFCHQRRRQQVISSGHELQVVLSSRSPQGRQGIGFNASYQFIPTDLASTVQSLILWKERDKRGVFHMRSP